MERLDVGGSMENGPFVFSLLLHWIHACTHVAPAQTISIDSYAYR